MPIMTKATYWAIGAGALLAVVWLVARRQESAPAGSVPDATAGAPSASPMASSDTRKPGTSTEAGSRPSSIPSPSVTPSASAAGASTALPVAGNAMPIDVSPGFDYLSKPAAEMKDTDAMWGAWRWHQKLQDEPRDEAWAPRVEAALRQGVLDILTAKGLDTQRIELPVIECRTSGCEIQAVGYLQDSMQEGFDYQQVLGGILAGPLGNEFDLNNHVSRMSTRSDNRVVILTHLPRKGI
jgi:hypothetical protein